MRGLIGYDGIDLGGGHDEWNVRKLQVGRANDKAARDAVDLDQRSAAAAVDRGSRMSTERPRRSSMPTAQARAGDQVVKRNLRLRRPNAAIRRRRRERLEHPKENRVILRHLRRT